ncbi:MAG: hypothetical protein IID37_10385 [Planctomycetes bacterium]|nr:hypothetical protein [Planctomycetota bacterium]
MNKSHLQITTVYSSSGSSSSWGHRLVGLMSLAVAAIWLYTLWTRVDPELGVRHNMSMPIALFFGADLTFGRAPVRVANPAPPEGTTAVADPQKDQSKREGESSDHADQMAEARQFIVTLTALMYGWEGLATFAGLWLVVAGAAATLGARGAAAWRGRTSALAFLAFLGVIAYVAWIWRSLGTHWELKHVHLLVGALGLFSALFGAAVSRGGIRLLRGAAWILILSTVASVIAILWAHRLGASVDRYASPAFLIALCAVQSGYAWFLLVVVHRAR